ncbi:hypothetical protein, partial [Streptomyces avidinii]
MSSAADTPAPAIAATSSAATRAAAGRRFPGTRTVSGAASGAIAGADSATGAGAGSGLVTLRCVGLYCAAGVSRRGVRARPQQLLRPFRVEPLGRIALQQPPHHGQQRAARFGGRISSKTTA